MEKLNIVASQPQHTDAGKLVGALYYGGVLSKLLDREDYAGYPHNGGEHTLRLYLTPPDLKAFLDLVAERFAAHPGLTGFLAKCKESVAKRYPEVSLSLT